MVYIWKASLSSWIRDIYCAFRSFQIARRKRQTDGHSKLQKQFRWMRWISLCRRPLASPSLAPSTAILPSHSGSASACLGTHPRPKKSKYIVNVFYHRSNLVTGSQIRFGSKFYVLRSALTPLKKGRVTYLELLDIFHILSSVNIEKIGFLGCPDLSVPFPGSDRYLQHWLNWYHVSLQLAVIQSSLSLI